MSKVVVLFEVKPMREGMKRYLDLAAMLKPMLSGFEGFIREYSDTDRNEAPKNSNAYMGVKIKSERGVDFEL